jgi:pyruvate synthase
MADRPAAQKDEEYQPLWDTDQSVPEYMALLMDQQASEKEDTELHENSENSNELEDASEDAHESCKDDEANHPVALASTEPAPSPGAQTEVIGAAHAYGEYILLEHLGLHPGAILPVIPEPFFGIPDPKLIEMRLLDRSQDESAPMQACAAHLSPVKDEGNPTSRASKLQPVGYVPINNPFAGSNIEEINSQRTFWKAVLIVLLILNPFVLVPLVSMFDSSAGISMLLFFITIGVGSLFVVPVLWIVGIVQAVKRKNQLRELIQKIEGAHAEFWYYLVYNRLPDGYTGINGYTKKEEDSFSVYEFLKKQEHAKLHESVAPREAAALQKSSASPTPAAHPALADEEKQD